MAPIPGTPVYGTAGVGNANCTSGSITVAAGETLIAVSYCAGSASPSTCVFSSGSQSLTNVQVRAIGTGGSAARLEVWEIVSPSAGTGTVTFAHTDTAFIRGIAVFTVSGAVSGAGYRDTSQRSNATNTTPTNTWTSQAGDLVIAAVCWRDTNVTFTKDSGATLFGTAGTDPVPGSSQAGVRLISIPGAASVALGGTLSSSQAWGEIGFNLNTAGGSPPVADFSASATTGTQATTFTFTDASTNTPTSWAWDFGDSNTSTSQNPTHSYAADGTYTVELTATNADGSDTETKTGYITVATAPVAAFSADVLNGTATLAVTFTDASTNSPTSWAWDFDDPGGTETSTSQNPTYNYTTPGTYSVKLTATNATGSGALTKTNYITVSAPGTEANRVRRGQRFLRAATTTLARLAKVRFVLQHIQRESLARFTAGGTQGTGASTTTGGATSTGGRVRHLSLLRLNRRRR